MQILQGGGMGALMTEWLLWLRAPLGCGPGIRRLFGGAAMAALILGSAPGRAEPWKDCAYNDRPIPCRDSHSNDGTVRIVWKDGKAMTYRLVKEGFPLSTLRDTLGGLWEREIYVQGNAVFANKANGNRVFVPLR
ncbi:hypothetical protein [Vulcanococcus limneticus]|uniref:hypothetical protein n=2 Tax=Vulcanococcus limneticus TaxID=2170428 RepID=UPI001E57513B|nr:hypothetical protein [Vulcanococcus limneticus]